ncbi:tryptophan-rich sensory protein [Jeotgalibacillus proteolyticus]|uniref:tryptophan-rich sensory protein n=1 Tax=Jeotgalibacillus proteolyticus TaxID=2082395 RepID=UPI003CED2DC1
MIHFFVNLLALIAVIAVNALANILPINGQTTGEISDRLNVLFTPAGYVFSIWSLIYVLLFIWVVRGAFPSQRNRDIYTRTSALFVASSVFNITWILVWHYEFFIASVFVMLGLLGSLILLYLVIQRNEPSFFDRLPFSVYLGWVSVATITNISYTLTYYEWDGFGLSPVLWAVIGLVVGTFLALWFRYTQRDWVYPLVFIWAYIGIAVKNQGTEPTVVFAAIALAVVIVIGTVFLRKKKKKLSGFSTRKLTFK